MALLCAQAGKPVLSASCGTLATCPQPQAAAVSSLGKGAESSQVLTPPLPCQFKAIDPVGLCVYLPLTGPATSPHLGVSVQDAFITDGMVSPDVHNSAKEGFFLIDNQARRSAQRRPPSPSK